MNTAHLYFDFVIDREYLTDWKDEKLPLVHVFYTLDREGNVEVKGWTLDPGAQAYVTDWSVVKKQILIAAQNNAEDFKWPIEKKRGRMRPKGLDPYQDIHDQWRMEARGY